jgi:hypothetical protein
MVPVPLIVLIGNRGAKGGPVSCGGRKVAPGAGEPRMVQKELLQQHVRQTVHTTIAAGVLQVLIDQRSPLDQLVTDWP